MALFGIYLIVWNLTSRGSAPIVYPSVLRLGQTATNPTATLGIRSVTVFAFNYPAPIGNGITSDTYAVADVQECAGPKGLPATRQPPIGPWGVNFSPGTQGGGNVAGTSSMVLRQPEFDVSKGLRPSQCERGWLTFQVDGRRPFYVSFAYPYAYWRVSS